MTGFRGDFIEWLGPVMSVKILMCLDDPSDLVRVSAVSSSWHQFVIKNGFCKNLCLRMFPEISGVAHVIEVKNVIEPIDVERHNDSLDWAHLKRDHRVYAFLTRGFTSFVKKDCISKAIVASSTDNYPEESVQNTLEPNDRVGQIASYWSSTGESDPEVPERLTYKLSSRLCMITEINVQPFQAYFQFGFPLYSAKGLRFRMGHQKVPNQVVETGDLGHSGDVHLLEDDFIWTYTSPLFEMAHENRLQNFVLPEPVLCIGGILQVELCGRVQRQEMDGLFYICVAHVQAVGRPLTPAFDIEMLDQSGKCTLKYYPEEEYIFSPAKSPGGESSSPSRQHGDSARIRGLEQIILSASPGAGAVVMVLADDGDDDSDID